MIKSTKIAFSFILKQNQRSKQQTMCFFLNYRFSNLLIYFVKKNSFFRMILPSVPLQPSFPGIPGAPGFPNIPGNPEIPKID